MFIYQKDLKADEVCDQNWLEVQQLLSKNMTPLVYSTKYKRNVLSRENFERAEAELF